MKNKKTVTITLNESTFEQYDPSGISVKLSKSLSFKEYQKIAGMFFTYHFELLEKQKKDKNEEN